MAKRELLPATDLLFDVSEVLWKSALWKDGKPVSLKDILNYLFENGYDHLANDKSFKPRLCGLLHKWVHEGRLKEAGHCRFELL